MTVVGALGRDIVRIATHHRSSFFPMRCFLLFLFFALFIFGAHSWDKYDHEIFDLVSELEAAEGKGTTFYSFLGVEYTATMPEIAKAYRRKSIILHPDKNPGVKGSHERFARLGVISTILRSDEGRTRYDFFHKNGVPKWRGTGYYYTRFRPGLGTVLTFLITLTSGLQYIIQKINYKNDLTRIQQFVSKARLAAWGPKLNPIEGKRKVKVNVGGGEDEENPSRGKWIDMVVEGDDVYILEPDGQLLLLDDSAASPPALSRTWFMAMVVSIYMRRYRTNNNQTEQRQKSREEMEFDETDSASDVTSGENARGLAAAKAGAKRRKTVKRR
ncbi:DnaJ-domain-containing protein [Ramaria rubella]|nr:DnaJ-domain-containing protein [Ramaria rubella]